MNSRSFRLRVALIAVSALLVCCTFLSYLFISHKLARLLNRSSFLKGQVQPPYNTVSRVSTVQVLDLPLLPPLRSKAVSHSHMLGIASQVFVLSLPRRVDRRITMDALSHALDFEFVYVDGVEATDESIDQVLRIIRVERHTFRQNFGNVVPNALHVPKYAAEEGPADAEDSGSAGEPLSVVSLDNVSALVPEGVFEYGATLDLPCATPEDPFPAPLTAIELDLLPPWRILSRGMIACWIGHLNIIREVLKLQLEVAIVLEDDVDLEYDTSIRLMDMWPALPQDGWDIVMLDESIRPPLVGAPSLHPSSAPKCTHAYAVSRTGAKRLARMLSAPGFAYSRALDQAISWLISTDKIRSYSVVPAIVIQTKRTVSDIWRPLLRTKQPNQADTQGQRGSDDSDKGSNWRDVLMDSTLERLGVMADVRFT